MIRVAAAAVLLVLGLAAWRSERAPQPTPAPGGDVVLRGQFIGPTAAEDAATLAALCDELAAVIEWDGMKSEPRLRSGVALDEVRVAAREARCRGESIGERQPRVREAIEEYLTATVGTSGGPVTPEGRAKWISAYRELGRACSDAAR